MLQTYHKRLTSDYKMFFSKLQFILFVLFLKIFTKTGLSAPTRNNSRPYNVQPVDFYQKAKEVFLTNGMIWTGNRCAMRLRVMEIKIAGCRPKELRSTTCEGSCFSVYRMPSRKESKLMECRSCLPSKVVYTNVTLTCGEDGHQRSLSHPVILGCRCKVINCGY